MPQSPPAIKGLRDVRGDIVPVVDARRALGHEPREVHHNDHLIFTFTSGRVVGLHVDHALEIVEIENAAMKRGDQILDASHGAPTVAHLNGGLLPIQLLDAIVGDLGSFTRPDTSMSAIDPEGSNVPVA
jgi:purine-binding chemotaxis protein CheW